VLRQAARIEPAIDGLLVGRQLVNAAAARQRRPGKWGAGRVWRR
jgi:hypothetical protein